MNHPTYPLQAEQRAAILALDDNATNQDVDRIVAEFNARRYSANPHWLDEYEAEVKRWSESISTNKPQPTP